MDTCMYRYTYMCISMIKPISELDMQVKDRISGDYPPIALSWFFPLKNCYHQ